MPETTGGDSEDDSLLRSLSKLELSPVGTPRRASPQSASSAERAGSPASDLAAAPSPGEKGAEAARTRAPVTGPPRSDRVRNGPQVTNLSDEPVELHAYFEPDPEVTARAPLVRLGCCRRTRQSL